MLYSFSATFFGYEKVINFFQKYKIGPKELFTAITDAFKAANKDLDNIKESLLKKTEAHFKENSTDQNTYSQKNEYFQAWLTAILGFIFATAGTILAHSWLSNSGQNTLSPFSSSDNLSIFIAWLYSFIVFYFCIFIAMLSGSLVIQFIANTTQTEKGVRLINLFIVLIGFTFDILAT